MDMNLFRGILTAVLLVAFIGIAVWAFWPSRKQKKRFEDAANLPLEDEEDRK